MDLEKENNIKVRDLFFNNTCLNLKVAESKDKPKWGNVIADILWLNDDEECRLISEIRTFEFYDNDIELVGECKLLNILFGVEYGS